jgi:hypothetical protein
VLKRLSVALRRKRGELWRERSLNLHHDNAPANSSLQILQFLAGKGISVMDHPLYSPGLASADFSLLPELKSVLKGKRFLGIEDIKSSVKKIEGLLFRVSKTVLNNGRSAGNIVKNWGQTTLKYCRLLIFTALKINI